MRELVRLVRQVPPMLGERAKEIMECERDQGRMIRRSIVAGADLPAGHTLRMADLTWTRPAGGLEPGKEASLIGRRLRHPVRFGDRLNGGDLE
jgi:sialic acid synthase SpsE